MPQSKKRTKIIKRKNTPPPYKTFLSTSVFLYYRRHAMSVVLFLVAIVGFAAYMIAYTQITTPTGDDRAVRLDAYFTKYKMPLAGYGPSFIAVADECGMDWRLLPAIAVRESSGGKHMQFNNPFGWGGARIPFEDINHAIRVVGLNLCGDNPKTARYYDTPSVRKKLYYYNGTVIPSYPKEVMWIMKQF